MEVTFADDDYEKLEFEAAFTGGWSASIVASFRRKMQLIRAAVDERDFYAMKSLHYEKLAGNRQHQHSMRLNEQYRLVVEVPKSSEQKSVRIIAIEDYH